MKDRNSSRQRSELFFEIFLCDDGLGVRLLHVGATLRVAIPPKGSFDECFKTTVGALHEAPLRYYRGLKSPLTKRLPYCVERLA